MLKVTELSAGYGDVPILHGVSLNVEEGEIVSVIGANGAGKTTLLRAIMGSIPTTSGESHFEGQRITSLPTHRIAQLGLAQVLEGRRLFPHMSVEDNLNVGGDVLDTRARRERFEWVTNLFPRLLERRSQMARSLSGGEQQMVAIGRALMSAPRLLLLDEPSIGLAPVIVKDIFSRFKEINASGVTILLVEQDVRLALGISNRGYVVEQGRVVLDGPSKSLLDDKELLRAYLGVDEAEL